jgi:hypothetical protein
MKLGYNEDCIILGLANAVLSEQIFEVDAAMAREHCYSQSLLWTANERRDFRREALRQMAINGGCWASYIG